MKIRFLFVFAFLYACSNVHTKNAPSVMSYEIIGSGPGRFDNAPTYIVLIKKSMPGPGFKDSIKSIVNEFARKEGNAKFSLDIYDDPEVVKVVMETIVSQRRLYSKDEGKQMNQHCVASYCGGLMFDGKPALVFEHQLDFFPDIKHAIKSGPKVEQQESMEYIPK